MSFGEQFEQMVQEFVDNAVSEKDFSDDIKDAVKEEMPDVDDVVQEKIRDFDFSDAIHDAIRDYDFSTDLEKAVDDYDMSDAVDNAIHYCRRTQKVFQNQVDESVQENIEKYLETDEFAEKVRAVVVRVLWDVLTFKALRQRLMGRAKECKVTVIKFTKNQINRFKKAA
jgi:hypothetical protein